MVACPLRSNAMIDSHCHLAGEVFEGDLGPVVERARSAGVQRVLCILGAGEARESAAAQALRALWPTVRFAVGVHPHHAGQFEAGADTAASLVRQGVAAEGASAIGEIGLDYHYDFAPRATQQAVFGAQVALARELRLPIVIHAREASEDVFRIIREAGQGDVRGVFHCFTGDQVMARTVLDLGFHISIGGIITFPRSAELREVARLVPVDRLLIETDAPYLAPVPHRGKRNEPAFVARVLEDLASLRGLSAAALGTHVVHNFDALLGTNGTESTV